MTGVTEMSRSASFATTPSLRTVTPNRGPDRLTVLGVGGISCASMGGRDSQEHQNGQRESHTSPPADNVAALWSEVLSRSLKSPESRTGGSGEMGKVREFILPVEDPSSHP